MEIVLEENKPGINEFIVREASGRFKITTTWISEECDIRHWWEQIKRIYRREFRSKTIVIGLCADRGIHNTHRSTHYNAKYRTKEKANEPLPYELLQICVGNHCVIGHMGFRYGFNPKALRNLLHEPRATIVGVGINKLLNKLASDHEWAAVPTNTADLGALAAKAAGDNSLRIAKFAKLTESVLGDDMRIVRPINNVFAWDYDHDEFDYFASSDDLKYISVEVFLTSQMGCKLLFPSKFNSNKFRFH